MQELLPFENDLILTHWTWNYRRTNTTRIDAPMVRKSWFEGGPGHQPELRGVDPFVAVSWEEANKLVAGEIDRVRKILAIRRFLAGLWERGGAFSPCPEPAAPLPQLRGWIRSRPPKLCCCRSHGTHILGSFREYLDTSTSWDLIRDHTELFVCFGGIPLKNGQISQGGTGRHTSGKN